MNSLIKYQIYFVHWLCTILLLTVSLKCDRRNFDFASILDFVGSFEDAPTYMNQTDSFGLYLKTINHWSVVHSRVKRVRNALEMQWTASKLFLSFFEIFRCFEVALTQWDLIRKLLFHLKAILVSKDAVKKSVENALSQ